MGNKSVINFLQPILKSKFLMRFGDRSSKILELKLRQTISENWKKVSDIFWWNLWKYLAIGQVIKNLEKSKMYSFIISAEYGHGFLN